MELAQLREYSHFSLDLLLCTDCWVQGSLWAGPSPIHFQGVFWPFAVGLERAF